MSPPNDPLIVVDSDYADAARQSTGFIDPRDRLARSARRVEQGVATPQDFSDTAIREQKSQSRPVVDTGGAPSVEGSERNQALTDIQRLNDRLKKATSDSERDKLTADIHALAKKLGYVSREQADKFTLGMTTRLDQVNRISSNVLSDYMLVQYHFALTMLSVEDGTVVQDQLAKSKGEISSINLDADLGIDRQRKDKSVTIASTGEAKRNFVNIDIATREVTPTEPSSIVMDYTPSEITAKGSLGTFDTSAWNYYNIEAVTMENTLAPSANNPAIAEMLTMKMRIIEPHGFRLVEDLRLIANNLGWEYVPSSRVIYRVDLWFSGYNGRTGEWVANIPFKSDYGTQTLQALSYYVNIATMEAKLDGRGTVYEVGFVPTGHQAWRPEDVVFDSMTVAKVNGTDTFGGFLDTLQEIMETTRKKNTNDLIKRKYRFFAPDVIRTAKFNVTKFFNKKNMLDASGGSATTSRANIDAMKLVEEAWTDCDKIQDMFLKDTDEYIKFLDPRVMLSFEFNTLYSAEGGPNKQPPTNKKINDYDTIYHQYKIVPYISFRKGITTEKTIDQYMDPKNQVDRIRAMIRYGMIQRIYDYIYTGNNTEVLNLDLSFQNFFYYQALWPIGGVSSPGGSGIGTSARAGSLTQARGSGTSDPIKFDGLRDDAVDQVLKQVFGEVNVASGGSPQDANPYQRISVGNSSMNTLPYPDLLQAAALSSDAALQRAAKFLYYRNDHLQRDMLVIELEIKGDPIWLMTAYGNASLTSLNPLANGIDQDVTIVPKTDRALFLRLHAPIQDDYMNPDRKLGSSHPLIIGGFYQVLRLESTFSQGKFTQKLRCTKYEHLNYIEQYTEKGYGKLFLIPPGQNSPNQGPPSERPGSSPGPTTSPGSGIGPQAAVPDTGTIIKSSPGLLPIFAPSSPDAGSRILGLKNNNPGNLRFGGGFDGTVGRNNGFDVYDSPQRGVQNLWKNLVSYKNAGYGTIEKIIYRWAPPSDGNRTGAYIAGVAAAAGIPANQPVDFSNKELMTKIIHSIITHEIGGGTRYTQSYIRTSLGW